MTGILVLANAIEPDDAAMEREIDGLERRARMLPSELVFGELRGLLSAMSTLQRLDNGRAVARLYAIATSLANRLLATPHGDTNASAPCFIDGRLRTLQ